MLIALAAKVGNSLASKEREVSLNACANGALAECPKLLPMLLAIKDCGFESSYVKVLGNQRQLLERK